MKKLVSTLSLFAFVTMLFFLPFGMTSCTKETVRVDTVPPVIVNVKLTDHTWKISEIRTLQNNTNYYYKRGAAGNTINFDNEYIKFNTNFTGEYSADGLTYSLTWEYRKSDSSEIRYTVAYPKPLVITWENIRYYEGHITYSEYYTKEGMNTLSTVKRIPQ